MGWVGRLQILSEGFSSFASKSVGECLCGWGQGRRSGQRICEGSSRQLGVLTRLCDTERKQCHRLAPARNSGRAIARFIAE